jgi:hypothetical protein
MNFAARFALLFFVTFWVPFTLMRPLERPLWKWLGPANYAPLSSTGSGDTFANWVHVGVLLVLALVLATIWTMADRPRPSLYLWLRLFLRYSLATILFNYGFSKVFPGQFQPTTIHRLLQPYGSFSPMGVLWSFMGASMPYTIFSGVAEVVPALLLIFPRTATLGGLLAAAVLTNVVALNMFYDVPVKLNSSLYLVMALIIAAPDFGRLWRFFVQGQAVEPATPAAPMLTSKPLRWIGRIARALFIANVALGAVESYQRYQTDVANPTYPPIYGVFTASIPGQEWTRLTFAYPGSMDWIGPDGAGYLAIRYTENGTKLQVGSRIFTFTQSPTELVLHEITGPELRYTRAPFELTSRGFHWVTELPYNR